MLRPVDPFWLPAFLASANEALISTLYVVGFVVALRRWNGRGRSARFAAAGFGIGLLGDIGGMALAFVNMRFFGPAPATPADQDPFLWPMFVASSLRSFARLASTLLILLALWSAWRDADRADRDPVR